MGLHPTIKKFLKDDARWSKAFIKSVEKPVACVCIEDILTRLHSWGGKTRQDVDGENKGFSTTHELFVQTIGTCTNKSPDSYLYDTYVFCCDNQERVSALKLPTQKGRDKEITPYEDGCTLERDGIRRTNGDIELIDVLRFCRTRYLRRSLMLYVHAELKKMIVHHKHFDLEKIKLPKIIIDACDDDVKLYDFNQLTITDIAADEKCGVYGEADTACVRWITHFATNKKATDKPLDLMLRSIDGDWIAIAVHAVQQLHDQKQADCFARIVFQPNSYAANCKNMDCIDIRKLRDCINGTGASVYHFLYYVTLMGNDYFSASSILGVTPPRDVANFFLASARNRSADAMKLCCLIEDEFVTLIRDFYHHLVDKQKFYLVNKANKADYTKINEHTKIDDMRKMLSEAFVKGKCKLLIPSEADVRALFPRFHASVHMLMGVQLPWVDK
jgi:hypothetical protein